MNYQAYKFVFQTDVHFGSGGLTKGQSNFLADTLFSALCIEAVRQKNGALEHLTELAFQDRVRFSDGLPFIGQIFYIPKPVMELKIENSGNSVQKKALKNLAYLPVDQLDDYINGRMDIQAAGDYFSSNFGKRRLIEKAVIHPADGATPFAVQTFSYGSHSGLYILVGYESEEDLQFVEGLLDALSLTGIGGEVSSGYGKFELRRAGLSDIYQRRLSADSALYMTLSVSLPADDELDRVIQDAYFRMIKRSGFITSHHYADTTRKKKDFYVLAAGATVKDRFAGMIADVSEGGRHPVYRYAKPILLGVM